MRKKKNFETGVVRVALYIRVSNEEQKIKGLSLEAQQERLEAYAKGQGWIIAGIFIDAAKTARKNMYKRSEFLRMMNLVRNDEVDLLLFCRLDRWFRSVADYYKVMEVLEAHGCGWKTIDEEYDTTTANGRLYINVKLSIAQNEADICGERIDVVFDSKIAHGTMISGSVPFGYRINKEKRLEVVPGQAEIVKEAFGYFEMTVSKLTTIKYIRNRFGVNWCGTTFQRMLSEELYTGVYNRNGRYNGHFCPPIISREQFDRVQELLNKNARSLPSGRVYLFTSLLICEECNHRLVGTQTLKKCANGMKAYNYYRCNQSFLRGRCSHSKRLSENKVEAWLFDHLSEELERTKLKWETQAAEKKRAVTSSEKATLKAKLNRLKDLYVNGLIEIEEYKKDYEVYAEALRQIREPEAEPAPDYSAVEAMLQDDFRAIYDTLTREEKRTLWRSVIREIKVNNDNEITGIFFA